ncbi:DUF2804 domain-containing protein [uncultured Shewanella sp.]|uniref:DUF2804 domain-containing protein n=1 Tax=uncultured Shewanella sp. TaxID=173975 RepID=UPI0026266D09|nr:DUF2804 domain-containing protein [uncultured Shewanella sp.]
MIKPQLTPSETFSVFSHAPSSLVSRVGEVIYGHFNGPVDKLGVEHFEYRTTMDKPASKLSQYLAFKQFQFVSVTTPEFIISVAIADIRYLGSAFCFIYDIKNDEFIEIQWLKLASIGCEMACSPMEGLASIKSHRGEIKLLIAQGAWQLKVKTVRLSINIDLVPLPHSLPLAMCTPTGYRGWTYTQKHNGLSVHGDVSIDNKSICLNKALASYDFSAGFMRRETSWRWGSLNAHLNGAIIGLNLAAGVNETGINENIFWFNGERHYLAPVHFQIPHTASVKGGLSLPLCWRIYSEDKKVNLVFTPKNVRREKLNFFFLKSNFRQYLGHYSGTIIDNRNRVHQLDGIMGLAEDHYAQW